MVVDATGPELTTVSTDEAGRRNSLVRSVSKAFASTKTGASFAGLRRRVPGEALRAVDPSRQRRSSCRAEAREWHLSVDEVERGDHRDPPGSRERTSGFVADQRPP